MQHCSWPTGPSTAGQSLGLLPCPTRPASSKCHTCVHTQIMSSITTTGILQASTNKPSTRKISSQAVHAATKIDIRVRRVALARSPIGSTAQYCAAQSSGAATISWCRDMLQTRESKSPKKDADAPLTLAEGCCMCTVNQARHAHDHNASDNVEVPAAR